MEINNFYTVTVYEKGAEVVRLYQTLLGVDGFRRGMDLYFKHHDGQAVCTEDFLVAMGDANDMDVSQMQHWYSQAGTPKLAIDMVYDEKAQTCTLHCQQSCPATPEASDKKPYLIPLTLGLLQADGTEHVLQLACEDKPQASNRTVFISQAKQSFTFINIASKPLPSLLRGFSAPVELDFAYSAEDLAFLMQYDSDSFNRWAAAQQLAKHTLISMIETDAMPDATIYQAFASLLADVNLDDALKAETLILPSESDIAECFDYADPAKIHTAREKLRHGLAKALHSDLEAIYMQRMFAKGLDDKAMQQRKLKNVCLSYLSKLQDGQRIALAYKQFQTADNMTDQYAALVVLSHCDCDERIKALQSFEKQWLHETNVMDKWFAVQAMSSLPHTLEHVKTLMQHEKFDMKNPNKVRALISSFALRNPALFHAEDGSGYVFVAEQVVILDALNPQVASRLVRALMNWKRLEPKRGALMRSQLELIADTKGLSGDVFEIVSKSLA